MFNINKYANWEGQIIKISGGGLPKSVIICNLYRPPRMLQDQIRQFINELSMVLSTIERKNNDVLYWLLKLYFQTGYRGLFALSYRNPIS